MILQLNRLPTAVEQLTRKNIIARTVSSNNKIVSSRFFEQSNFEQMIMTLNSTFNKFREDEMGSVGGVVDVNCKLFDKSLTYVWLVESGLHECTCTCAGKLVTPFSTDFPKMPLFYFIGLISDEFLLKFFRCHIISPVTSMGFLKTFVQL